MVAVLILHGESDLDWAAALSNDLKEHSPVRFQVGAKPPHVTFGPSVVRIGLWSENSAASGIADAMSALIGSGTKHSVLIRPEGCAPPNALDVIQLAGNIVVADTDQAAEALRPIIPRIADSVETFAVKEQERVESIKDRRLRLLDTLSLIVVLGLLGAATFAFNWGGARTAVMNAITTWTEGSLVQ